MNELADIFELHTDGVLDLRRCGAHPISLRYSEVFKESLHEADVALGRITPGFCLVGNPPFKAACDKITDYSDINTIKSVLWRELMDIYQKFQPSTFSDFFGIDFTNEKIRSCEPWAGVLPWRARSLLGYRQRISEGTFLDNQKQGCPSIGIEKGWAYCGPVSDEKINVEVERLANLIASVKENGFLRGFHVDGDITATALVDGEGHWRWLVTNGYHRASVVASLGFKTIPVRINSVVLRSEAAFWPHVVDGLYTQSEAVSIFDKLFRGWK